ncbi:MAG: sigma 54-interacting transcriptional regulator [Hydrogenophilales bacterium]|nr:sigma 54-interacting transcriptional regulator [Hydrogenophilales bacterium]
MESEFFGYRKGAFTGANTDREGFFQAASGGTLFLDEVAELPMGMQVKLLRAIQERRVRRVGDVSEDPVDVR